MDTTGFAWSELSAADPDVAVRFFGRLLGWERDRHGLAGRTQPIEYSLLVRGGRNVAGLFPMVAAQRKRGTSPQWISYLFVADVDACAARARELGAELLAAPREVFQLGRMALARDPAGALLGLWQPRHLSSEFQTRGEVGFVSWLEHVSSDVAGAARFYAELCGWQARTLPGTGRCLLDRDGHPVAGLSSAELPGARLAPQWLPFLRVEDCGAACGQLAGLGATLLLPPQGDPASGLFAVARDPQGAAFGLIDR